jgi:hypothetical protein
MADYTNYASIVVKNDLPFAVEAITLRHRYSKDSQESMTWMAVPAGGVTRTNADCWLTNHGSRVPVALVPAAQVTPLASV